MTALTAVLGTTISPYLFFWQASQEVEEQKNTPGEKALKKAPSQTVRQLEPMRADTYFGMAVSNVIAYFIMLDTGALLHAHGVTHIETATQAAEALRPVGGEFAFCSSPSASSAPACWPCRCWPARWAMPWRRLPTGRAASRRSWPSARAFYGTIASVTLLGLALNLTRISPLKALFWSAVINGMCAGPIMVLVMLMTTNRAITGGLEFPKPQWVIGWISTGVMLAVAGGTLAGFAFP